MMALALRTESGRDTAAFGAPTMTRQDWLILTLAGGNGTPLTPAQLQKSLFLLGKEMPNEVGSDFYVFEPYHYGPFNSGVYADAEQLAASGLVRIEPDASGRSREYSLTATGQQRASSLQSRPSPGSVYLAKVVRWAQSCTFPQLIRAIYAKFPDMRERSIFRGA